MRVKKVEWESAKVENKGLGCIERSFARKDEALANKEMLAEHFRQWDASMTA